MKDKSIFSDGSWLTISNGLTFARIILAPVMMVGILQKMWFLTFWVFVVASWTDLLDGYLARRFNTQTGLGAVLDPIADKIFLLSCFSGLSFLDSPSFHIPTWFFFMVLGREFIISFGFFILMILGKNAQPRPTIWGKLTTFFQLLFIFWIFVCYFFGWAPVRTYGVFLILLAVFSVLSLLHYIRMGIGFLKE